MVEFKMFKGKRSSEYNAVLDAMMECGRDHMRNNGNFDDTTEPSANDCYEWLEESPKGALTTELVDKLHEMGFKIVKIKTIKSKPNEIAETKLLTM